MAMVEVVVAGLFCTCAYLDADRTRAGWAEENKERRA